MSTDPNKSVPGFGEERAVAWGAAPAAVSLASLPFATAIAMAVRDAGITEEISGMFEQSLADIRSARSDAIHRAPYTFGLDDDA